MNTDSRIRVMPIVKANENKSSNEYFKKGLKKKDNGIKFQDILNEKMK